MKRRAASKSVNDDAFIVKRVGAAPEAPLLARRTAFTKGNKLHARQPQARHYGLDAYPAIIRRNREFFTRERITTWPTTTPRDGLPEPIFFVGFPRSGTTLVEHMLAAHEGLVTSEELPLLETAEKAVRKLNPSGTAYPEGRDGLPEAAITDLRRTYWSAVTDHVGAISDAQRLVDKLPLNLVHLGLVRRLFPGAKVLVALRDPRDVVLSCFMQAFQPNPAMVHFYALDTAAELYATVMDQWRHDRAHLGLDYLEYRYEELVADTDATARRIVDFLGLAWSDDVLRYHERGRGGTTPSYRDVRQPIYDRSVGRWRHYRAALAPVENRPAPFVTDFGYGEMGAVCRERHHPTAGANPARQLSFQPVAIGASYGGNDIA